VDSNFLIAICKPTHARHHAQHVVVGSIHTHGGGGGSANSVVGHRQQDGGVINTRQVASTAGLVLLGLQGEGIHVDTHGRHVGVVLVGLHLVKVASLTHLEAVVAVELQQGSHGGVVAGQALHASHGVARLQHGAVPPVGVVEGLLSLPGPNHGVIARHEGIALHHPDQLLTGVVEVQLELVGGGGHGLTASELQGLDQVLVRHLGELAALVSVQVDVIHVEGGSHQAGSGHTVADGVGVGQSGGGVEAQVAQVVELQVDTHLVVLEGDQRQGQPRVAVEPELERHVQSVLRGTLQQFRGGVGLTASAVVVAILTALHQQIHQLRHVTHHLGVPGLLPRLLGELIPDLEPVTIVLVNALPANLELHVVDQIVPHPVQPAELSARAVRGQQRHRGQGGLEVDTIDQVTVALDSASHLATESGRTVEGVLNGLHRKVSVTTVDHLEKGDLGVTSEVNVLGAIGHELHETTTCHLIIPPPEKKNLAKRFFIRRHISKY
jgi:hypothetical protein